MDLNDAELGKEYSGEHITVVDRKKNLVVSIKDARYNIDPELGSAIHI